MKRGTGKRYEAVLEEKRNAKIKNPSKSRRPLETKGWCEVGTFVCVFVFSFFSISSNLMGVADPKEWSGKKLCPQPAPHPQ